jgi:PPOX class probable F420-dependent enzyme
VQEQRRRFADARVARLGTVTAEGRPHLVPVVFAVVGDVAYSAVDDKPKSTRRLHRLDHVAATGRASLLVDAYDEDWTALWWVRADGTAEVVGAASAAGRVGIDALVDKYPQYTGLRPAGPVIVVRIERWVSWSASDTPHPRAG